MSTVPAERALSAPAVRAINALTVRKSTVPAVQESTVPAVQESTVPAVQESTVPAVQESKVKEFTRALIDKAASAESLTKLIGIAAKSETEAAVLGVVLVKDQATVASFVSRDLQRDVVEDHTPYAHTIYGVGKDCAAEPMVVETKPFPERTKIRDFVPSSITMLLSSILCYEKTPSLKKMLEDFNSLDVFKFLQDKFKEKPINGALHLSRIICLCNVVDTINETFHIYFDNHDDFEAFKLKLSRVRKELNNKLATYVKPLALFHDVFEFEKCLTSVCKMKALA